MSLARAIGYAAIASAIVIAAYAQPLSDPNQMTQETIIGEHDCTKHDWQFARLAETSGLLKSEPLPTHTCRAVTLSWLPSAQIVQVTGWQHTDIFVSRTVIRATEVSPLRIVTALGSLVVNKDRENDAKNVAAFNELLRIAKYNPPNDQLVELAALYMFLVGHPPDERLRKLSDLMMTNDMVGDSQRNNNVITVEIHQRTSPPLSGTHREWILKFRLHKNYLQLVSVTPKSS